MTETITLEVELARELAYSDAGDTIDGYTVMLNEQIDTRRWESVHRFVIRDDETKKFYFDTYRLGLTESQDTGAYEYEKEATFHEVFAASKVTTVTDYVSASKVPDPEPEPDPSDPRQIAVSLMLDAARELDDIRDALPELLADLGIALSEAKYEALIDQLTKLAETADITIEWAEVTE